MDGHYPQHRPYVCVIIPTYNRSHYIAEAIDSVLGQNYEELSIIVVDDGSTDETDSILRSYGNRIKTVKQLRGGPGKARNAGMEMALDQCSYIAFLDSDDMWQESKIKTQVEIMESLPQIGFLFSEFFVLKNNGELKCSGLRRWGQAVLSWDTIFPNKRVFSSLVSERESKGKDFTVYWGDLYTWLLRDSYILPSSAMIRRECIEAGVRFPEGVYLYEDWDFFARIARSWDGGFMDVETTINRGHDDDVRLTRTTAFNACKNRLALIERVWRKDPDFIGRNEEMVRSIESDQLFIMAKEYLLAGETYKSRQTLGRIRELKIGKARIKVFALGIIARMPGAGNIMLALRKCLRIIRDFTHPSNPLLKRKKSAQK